ncbi:MAG TPA: hypothetical protein DCZ01_12340 [Elusimicrobia bacterium]|nr:MAG: hypothetical protein A2X40_02200 [Elusimicrobia bacterium GWC2_65_9]HAZ09277.1 hypothetical protein [Elusimicrobiota bacterium]
MRDMNGIFMQQSGDAWKRLLTFLCLLGIPSMARAISTTMVHVREFPSSASVHMQALPRASEVLIPQDFVKGEAHPPPALSVPHISDVSRIFAPTIAAGASSDIGIYLRDHTVLVDAAKIVNGTSFTELPSHVQRPLKSEFVSRENERNLMLPEADWVDDQANNRLGSWKKRLDMQLENLETETRAYVVENAQHQSRCNPAPDENTYDWCKKDHARLDDWRQNLGKRGDAYNIELEQFREEVRPYNSRLKTLLDLIQAWENGVLDLIRRLKLTLSETGTCTKEQHRQLQDDVDAKCKKEEEKRACRGNQECGVLRQTLTRNQACYDARRKIVDVCYNGQPNEGHQQALDEAQNAISKCLQWIQKRCGVGIGATPF